MALKHSKKRNTGLVYEFIVRKISESMITGDRASAGRALGIAKKYFGNSSPIGQELRLFNVVRRNRGTTETLARRIMAHVAQQAKLLDRRQIDIKKSNLIKELNHTFGQDFFSRYRIPDYRAIASIQVYIDNANGNRTIEEDVERMRVDEALVAYMSAPDRGPDVSVDTEHDPVTYKLAVRKFEERYDRELTDGQKKLLGSYVAGLFSGDFREFKSAASEDQRAIYREICSEILSDECKSDQILRERMNEAATKLKSLQPSGSEEFVEEMMLFHDLARELRS